MIIESTKHLSFVPFKMTGLITNNKSKAQKLFALMIENDEDCRKLYEVYGFYDKCSDRDWCFYNWPWITTPGNVLPWWKWQQDFKFASLYESNGKASKRFSYKEHLKDYDPEEIDKLLENFSLQKYYTKILKSGNGLSEEDWNEFSSLLSQWDKLDPIERETVEHIALSNKKTYEEIYKRLEIMISYNKSYNNSDPLWFITFTFSDDYITTDEDGSKELRPFVFSRLQKFAALYLGELYIINEDYGSKTERPHFHGVFNSLPFSPSSLRLSIEELNKLHALFEEWFPGCVDGINVEPVNIKTPDLKKISHYVSKLSHHATKTTTKKAHRIIYSKYLTDIRQKEKEGLTLPGVSSSPVYKAKKRHNL